MRSNRTDQILCRATPSARVLFRSASPEPHWLQQVPVPRVGGDCRVTDVLRFNRPLASTLHARDRVHTYASFHIADVVQ